MNRRRISVFQGTVNPFFGGKAGAKDPRNFVSGNEPGQQWDMEQNSVMRRSLELSEPPQYSQAHADRALPEVITRTIPTRINYIPWFCVVPAAGAPVILVPKNLARMDITLSPPNGVPIWYSWGQPLADPAGGFLGTRLLDGVPLARNGGVVPINDLWIFAAAGAVGSRVVAWEGFEALEANL